MWYLIPLSNPSEKYPLLVGKEYVVGRRDTDVVVNDPAVSRKHATIKLTYALASLSHVEKLPTVTLRDLSKFGTWLNDVRLKNETDVVLDDGSRIRFGSTKSTYMCVYEPFILTTSCLDDAGKKLMKGVVYELGGHLINEWTKDCSMLIMSSLSVTVKVVCALVSQKPIVTPQYVTAYKDALVNKSSLLPSTEDFLPVLAESQVNRDNVSSNAARQTLFSGLTFIFLVAKQFKKLHMAVELAGGAPILMEHGSEADSAVAGEPNTIVMHSDATDKNLTKKARDWVILVQSQLKKHEKRFISDSEIGYAVLYCTTERHCNPDIAAAQQMFSGLPSQSLSQQVIDTSQVSEVLATDTEPSQIRQRSMKPDPSIRIKTEKSSQSSIIDETVLPTQQTNKSLPKVKSEPGTFAIPAIPKITKLNAASLTASSSVCKTERENQNDKSGINIPYKKTDICSQPVPTMKKSARNGVANTAPAMEIEPTSQPVPTTSSENRTSNCDFAKNETSQSSAMDSDELGDTSDPFKKYINSATKSEQMESQRSQRSSRLKRNLIYDDDDDDDGDNENPFSIIPLKQVASSRTESNKKRSLVTDASVVNKTNDRPVSPKYQRKRLLDNEDDVMEQQPAKQQKTKSSIAAASPTVPVMPAVIELNTLVEPQPSTSSDAPNLQMGESRPASQSLSRAKQEPVTPQKPELVPESELESEVELADLDHNAPVLSGFLSSRQKTAGQTHIPVKEEVVMDNELPNRCINIEFHSLVTRQPQRQQSTTTTVVEKDGYMQWKGHWVKNFKKFKKNMHAGAGKLPQIIGGSDLQEHCNSNRKELDEWMQEALMAESQQDRADQELQAMFEYEPRGVGRGTGKRKR